MKSRRESVKDNTLGNRFRLIEAASTLMRERDTLDITLSEIAQESGVNSALVKYYFGSKEGLLFAVLAEDMRANTRSLEKLLSSGESPEEMMRVHLAGLVEEFSRTPYLSRLLRDMTRAATPERVKRIAEEFVKPVIDAQAAILDAGFKEGVFKSVDPVSFYFHTVGAASCLYAQRFVLKSAFDVASITPEIHARNLDQIVEIIMNGIVAD